MLKLSVDDFAAHARSLASPDELSVYVAKQSHAPLSPSLLWITLHDIDIAHSGTFSLYLDGIQRSDRLCAELWQTIQSEPEYANKTTMFILPDFGRDSDIDAGGNGFQHHRTGDPLSRTTWMMVLGPGVRQNTVVDRPIDSTDLIPTLGSLLGFDARYRTGQTARGDRLTCFRASYVRKASRSIRRRPDASLPTRIALLRKLPLAFVPLLLRELIVYDWKFPAERKDLDRQFAWLSRLSPESSPRPWPLSSDCP